MLTQLAQTFVGLHRDVLDVGTPPPSCSMPPLEAETPALEVDSGHTSSPELVPRAQILPVSLAPVCLPMMPVFKPAPTLLALALSPAQRPKRRRRPASAAQRQRRKVIDITSPSTRPEPPPPPPYHSLDPRAKLINWKDAKRNRFLGMEPPPLDDVELAVRQQLRQLRRMEMELKPRLRALKKTGCGAPMLP